MALLDEGFMSSAQRCVIFESEVKKIAHSYRMQKGAVHGECRGDASSNQAAAVCGRVSPDSADEEVLAVMADEGGGRALMLDKHND